MSESFIKKVIFIILFAVLAIVWGHNIYQMVPSGTGEYFRETKGSQSEKKFRPVSNSDKKKPPQSEYSGDPFKPFFVRENTTPKISSIKTVEKETVRLPDIRYLGLVRRKASKFAIIELHGDITEIIRAGDEISDIKILDFDDDSLRYKYAGKIHKIAIGG